MTGSVHTLNVVQGAYVRAQRQRHVARLSERRPDLRCAGQAEILPDGSAVHDFQLVPVVAGNRGEREAVKDARRGHAVE
ncbi:hypothetical protein MTO96_046354 [Rhipicephalus appendiculatus]